MTRVTADVASILLNAVSAAIVSHFVYANQVINSLYCVLILSLDVSLHIWMQDGPLKRWTTAGDWRKIKSSQAFDYGGMVGSGNSITHHSNKWFNYFRLSALAYCFPKMRYEVVVCVSSTFG